MVTIEFSDRLKQIWETCVTASFRVEFNELCGYFSMLTFPDDLLNSAKISEKMA